jgi:endonuclease III related protein
MPWCSRLPAMDRSSADAEATRRALLAVHDRLLAVYGSQRWWPGDTPFEVMVGAILTQNTAWSNVEKAMANLKGNPPYPPFFKGGYENSNFPSHALASLSEERESTGSYPPHLAARSNAVPPFEKGGRRGDFGTASLSPHHARAEDPRPAYSTQGILDPEAILAVSADELAQRIRPAGYFNVKAKRLRSFCAWYLEHGGHHGLARWDTSALRHALLKVNGVGPETADDILLYAFRRPVFVIDAYTRRLFSRLGLVAGDEDYETLRTLFEAHLPSEASLFNEYHALIVRHAKHVCRKQPRCGECCLADDCDFAHSSEGVK